MLSSKIQSMMHRDVDGMGVDDRHQRRHSQSQRQLGSYTDSFGQQQPDANHMHALQQRRRALAQANSQTDQMQERPSARRVASTGTLSSSASEARLLAALKRQQTNNLQDSDESADGSNAQPISAASASRAQNGTAPAVTPSAEATANGSADAKTLKVRPQIRPWKQTKGKPQDSEKLLALLENRYKGGGVNLGLGPPSVSRRGSSSRGGATTSGDQPAASEREGEDQQSAAAKGSQSSDSESSTPQDSKSMGKLEASIRRKGKALSKLSHRFRDIVNDKFHFQGRKESSSETSASLQANGNRSSPDTPTNGVSTTVNGSSQNGTGSFTQNSSNTTNGGSFSKSDAHSPSSHGNDSTDPLSPRDREQLSPLASLREREVIREREHPRDISSTPWKPRGSVLINGTSGGGGGGLLSPEKKNKAASSTAAEDQGREEMTQSLADDGRVVPPEDLMKLQVNGTAIELFKQPLGSPLSAASSRSSPSTSIADSLAAAAAAAALDSDGPSHALRSNFASPSSSHRSSVMGGTLSPATRGDRPDGVPLFLRKQSDLHPPHRDRAASNASALASPTTGSSSLFASPGGYGRDEASTKWAQELAGLRQHVSQHSSDIEGQISDIESALSNADIGTIKARLELLEDLQRNKKSDVETRLMRLEAELQNMKQVQRSNLKTIYDALSAQNLSTPSRRSDHGMGATFMNWIYVLITWFGLGLATMSQPLGAIYPYVAPLACCRRIFRKADAIASKASNGSPNGNSAAALDAYATNHQVLSSAQSSGGTTSGTGNSSSFLPAGAIPHHHSDRDRERHSVSARNKMNDRLAIPGGAANMLGGGGGAGAGSGSNSAQSRHRRMQTHSRHGSSMMNADDDEPTMAPPMRPSSAAPSFSDDDETQVDMLHPPSHLDDADAERELSSQAFALSDSDESSMQSDPIADAGDHSGFPAVSHHSRHSSSRSQGRSSGGSQQYSGSQKAAMSTMAQLRNVSKRLKESSRRN